MSINFHHLVLLAILATSIHWIVARASITRWFWSLDWWPCSTDAQKLPWHISVRDLLNGLLTCAACSGWWLGLAGGALGIQPLVLGPVWLNILGAVLTGVIVTPILEGVLLWGLARSRIE